MVWDTWLWFTTVNAMYRELNPSPAAFQRPRRRSSRAKRAATSRQIKNGAVYKGSATAMVPHATRWSLKGAKTWVP